MRQYYITNGQHSKSLQKHLLDQQIFKFGTQVVPFNALFYKESIERNVDTLLRYEHVLKMPLVALKDIIKYPAQFAQFDSFAKELDLYNIDPNYLPETNDYEKEIKQVVLALKTPLIKPAHKVYYVKDSLTHAQDFFLNSKNYEQFEIEDIQPKSIQIKTALNFRQELEGALQYIMTQNLDTVTLVVPNITEAWPYIQSIFNRYHIPYESKDNHLISKFQYVTFIDYLINPHKDTLLELLRSGLFKFKHIDALIQYVTHYQFELEDFFKPFDHALPNTELREVIPLIETQTLIQDDVLILQNHLQTILNQSLKDNLIYGLSLLDQNTSRTLVNFVQTMIQFISDDNLHYLKYALDSMNVVPHIKGKITVCDYKNLPLFPVENMFVLGLTATNYPNISPKTGILDENYLKKVNGYPPQEKRNEFELLKLKKIFSKSNNLILSYHVMSYEGKSYNEAFEISNIATQHNLKSIPWDIIEPNPFMDERKTLTPEIAQDLYLKEGILNVSVSSLEKFVRDPYLYFIEEGLKLRKPFDFKLDSRVVGTISHDVIERYLKEGEQDNLFDLWNIYRPYFPLNNATLPFLIETNEHNLRDSLKFLSLMQKDIKFKPYKQELYIKDETLFNGITLRGFVDRVDTYENSFIVIDYKSSVHDITDRTVLNAERLQLPIYAMALERQLGLNAFGIYYFSFNKKYTRQSDHKYTRTKGITLSQHATQEDYLKEFKLKGWTFGDPETYNTSGDYFTGIYESSGSYKVWRGPYLMKNLETVIKKNVEYLRKKILEGVIELDDLDLPVIKKMNFKKEGEDHETE